jgi:uroporphyrin-III C-methyltransferase/precorrin-2 dehydrogenase/sirohydrochlorin ferrochelatase
MRFLPLFFDLARGRTVLVGSTPQAIAKLHLLCAAGGDVHWFVQDIDVGQDVVSASRYEGKLGVTLGEPREEDFHGALVVVSSAGREIDERVAARARALNVPVNVVDRPDLSTFIFPAVVDRGDVVVAIGTGGASPVLARRLRERIEAMLPARIGALAVLTNRYREKVAVLRARGISARRFWEWVIDGGIATRFLTGRVQDAEQALARAIENPDASFAEQAGVVHLVGAGPGDPDLLTLRALHVLQSADVIFYDDLVGANILDRARRDADRIFVGKRKGAPGIGQDEINRRLVEAAKAGRCVVRLKGGDPFIFGRGGEELDYLRKADIPVSIVPGITAALGCAAEAELPLTLRSDASQLTLVTANLAEGSESVDWRSLANKTSTLVVYMGLSETAHVRDELIAAGRDPKTPAAVLARGTRPDAFSVAGPLEELASLATSVGEGPALLVIGEAVRHSRPWAERIVHENREIAA